MKSTVRSEKSRKEQKKAFFLAIEKQLDIKQAKFHKLIEETSSKDLERLIKNERSKIDRYLKGVFDEYDYENAITKKWRADGISPSVYHDIVGTEHITPLPNAIPRINGEPDPLFMAHLYIRYDEYLTEINGDEKSINKPHKDDIYREYEKFKREKQVKGAFYELCDWIKRMGYDVSEYIDTDTPQNFDRSYRDWVKRK